MASINITEKLETGTLAKVYLQKRCRAGRKSSYDLFAVEPLGVPVIVDTRFSTLAVKAAIEKKLFKPFENYRVAGENVKVNRSRLDVLLKQDARCFSCFLFNDLTQRS